MFKMQAGSFATYEWLNPSKVHSEYTNFINKVFLNKGEEKSSRIKCIHLMLQVKYLDWFLKPFNAISHTTEIFVYSCK